MSQYRSTSRVLLIVVLSISLLLGAADSLALGPSSQESKFKDPLADVTIVGFLTNVIKWLLGLSGALALLSIVVGGIRMILSFGDDQRVASAKRIIGWAVAGLLIILLSYAILNLISQLLGTG